MIVESKAPTIELTAVDVFMFIVLMTISLAK